MKRFRFFLHCLLIILIIVAPLTTVSAQGEEEEDCGFLGLGCSFLANILSLIADLVRGFFEWVGAAFVYFINVVLGIADFLVTAVRNIIQVIVNFFQPVFNLIAGILRLLVELIQIGLFIIQIIVGFFIAMGAFAVQSVVVITTLLTAYITSPVVPIPGLPQCVTAPQSYEICAMYYISDWTLFAPDTPGEIIVPLLVILLDITIVFFFIRRVLALISVGEKVTDV